MQAIGFVGLRWQDRKVDEFTETKYGVLLMKLINLLIAFAANVTLRYGYDGAKFSNGRTHSSFSFFEEGADKSKPTLSNT